MQLSQPAYLRYENGERTPSVHVIQIMADVLGASVAYLINESDNPNPDCFLIREETEPELFQLISAYKNTDVKMQKRLFAFLREFNKLK